MAEIFYSKQYNFFLLQYYNEAKGVCIHFMCVYCGSNILTIEKIMFHIMI